MQIVNLCDHVVRIALEDGSVVEIEPSGSVMRVDWAKSETWYVEYQGVQIPVINDGHIKGVRNLPPPAEGVLYLASHAAATYCNRALMRGDVVCPATTKKDGPIFSDSDLVAVKKLRGGDVL